MKLSTRLFLLIALALTPPLLVGIFNDVKQRNERAAVLDQVALAQSRSLQDDVALITQSARRLLIALAEASPVRSGDGPACTRYLQAVASRLRSFALLAAFDGNGAVLCNSAGSARGSYSVATRAFFRRALQSAEFASGDLMADDVTRRRSLHFALPFQAEDGRPGGVIAASIDQHWLAGQLANEAVPAGAEILLVDPSGTVIAASRDGEAVEADWIGRPAPPGLLQALSVSAPELIEAEGPDGRTRSFGALPEDPALAGLKAVVGIDRRRAFSDLRAASLRNLLGLGLGGLVALVVGGLSARRFVLGPLARIAAAADRVGAGDLNARADLGRQAGDLRELGAGFDRMIAALAAREQERDQAEAALRREEARLRFALDAGRLGSYEWNLATDVVHFSETVRHMFGFGPGQGNRSADFFDRIVAEDRARALTESQAGIRAGRVSHVFRIMRDGEQRHILSQGETAKDAAGTPFLIGLLADETERFSNIAALRESEARFQAIVDCIDHMVWSTRPDGYHDYFNQRWYDFTGATPGSTDGPSWLGLFHPDDRANTERIWQASLESGEPYYREYRLRHRSGEFRWVLGRAQPVRDEAGTVVRWYGTCTDIDEIVQARDVLSRSQEALSQEVAARSAELMSAEEQLRQAQKMEAVGQLTGGIAHDFNNMLQAISGALELLVRRVEQNKVEEAKRFAGIARSTVDRAAALTHRLLAFARRQTLSPEPVDPPKLLDSMSELVARTVGAAINVSTVHKGPPVGWLVLCDRNQLENVVFNLCINARDAMPGGGKLSMESRNVTIGPGDLAHGEGAEIGEFVEIAVGDNGTGMDEATQARAFEPFFTTKPLGQGTGLGLSQVYGFVRQSGGFVRLESAPGQGTTVRLFLPRHLPAADPVSDAPTGADAAGEGRAPEGGRALLIDSDAATRAAVAEQLRALGMEVVESDGGSDVMRLLSSELSGLALLVTRVGLPGNLNGRQVAEAARQRWPSLPVLLVTDFAGSLTQGELADGMAVVAAPFDSATLRRHVDELLGAGQPAAD